MTNKQIKWASKHDWFISSGKGKVVVRDDYNSEESIMFDSFKALYAWAGY